MPVKRPLDAAAAGAARAAKPPEGAGGFQRLYKRWRGREETPLAADFSKKKFLKKKSAASPPPARPGFARASSPARDREKITLPSSAMQNAAHPNNFFRLSDRESLGRREGAACLYLAVSPCPDSLAVGTLDPIDLKKRLVDPSDGKSRKANRHPCRAAVISTSDRGRQLPRSAPSEPRTPNRGSFFFASGNRPTSFPRRRPGPLFAERQPSSLLVRTEWPRRPRSARSRPSEQKNSPTLWNKSPRTKFPVLGKACRQEERLAG
jgi:hypothetical protein